MINKDDLLSFSVELVQNNIDRIFKGLGNLGSDSYKKLKVSLGTAFKDYLETAIKKYSEIKTILYRDAPVFLYDFYEDSELILGEHIVDGSKLENILNISNKVIITGSAGTGKSTLMKHLFLNAIEMKNQVPIFVELKNINNITDITENIHSDKYTLLDFIHSSITSLNFSLEKEYFMRAVDNGNLIFYFDGFDEVNPEIREKLSLQMMQLSDKYYENVIIVSSRPDDDFIAWNSFTEIKMLPLSKKKALNLISKIQYDTEIKERFSDELDKRLYENHKSFASNPLLVTIMLMSFSQYSDIPEKMYLFYQQAFETLFNKHDSTKGGYKRRMYTNLPMDDFVKILSAFSIQSYSNNNISFDYAILMKYLEGAKKITNIDYELYNYFRDLNESVSLIVKDGLLYTFSHRIFQEYFTAIFIVNSSDERQKKLISKLSSRFNTDNVFNMLFEIDKNRIERNYIIPLLEEIYVNTRFDQNDVYESSYNFILSLFSAFNIELASNNEKAVSYNLKDSNIFRFIRTTFIRYKPMYEFTEFKIPEKDITSLVNSYFPHKEQTINLEEITELELKRDLVESMPFVGEYIYLMQLLKVLKLEHQQQDNSIESILFDVF